MLRRSESEEVGGEKIMSVAASRNTHRIYICNYFLALTKPPCVIPTPLAPSASAYLSALAVFVNGVNGVRNSP